MYNFNKKQKIILGVLIAIVAVFVCYYVYAKEETDIQVNLEEEIKVQEKEEEYSDTMILVHVSGAVNQEGVVELKPNSRILDAIEKAGGTKEEASMDDINLAYKVEDGMKIHILTKQEKEEAKETYVTTESGISIENEQVPSTQKEKINLNTATQVQLETLPGIGPSTAIKIIDYRTENGKFSNIEDLKEVSGIGDTKFEKVRELVYVK